MKFIWSFYISLLSLIPFIKITHAQDFTLIPQEGDSRGLGKKFINGKFELKDIPLYIEYLVDIAVIAAALIAVLFIIYGGYQYLMTPVIEDKEMGKNTIMNAIMGLVVSILAWFIVNAALYVATSGL
jgi:hypothetical protein